MTNDTQLRAAPGGEFGPNGEWYRGGSFIATTPAAKGAGKVRRESPGQSPEDAARVRAIESRRAAWRAARAEQFAEYTAPYLTPPAGVDPARWLRDVESGNAGFEAGLAFELRTYGSLTARQAEYFVKFVLGRATKKNADQWDALYFSVQETFDENLERA